MKTRKGGYINVKRLPRINDYVLYHGDISRVISIRKKEIELEMSPGEKNIWVDPETVSLYDRTGSLLESDKYYHNKQELPRIGDKVTIISFNKMWGKEPIPKPPIRIVTKIFPSGKVELDGKGFVAPKWLNLYLHPYTLPRSKSEQQLQPTTITRSSSDATREPSPEFLEHIRDLHSFHRMYPSYVTDIESTQDDVSVASTIPYSDDELDGGKKTRKRKLKKNTRV